MKILFLILALFVLVSDSRLLKRRAFAVINGNYDGKHITGHVLFRQQSPCRLEILVHITGIPPKLGPRLGFHVHKNGIVNPSDNSTISCESSGHHYNPFHYPHGNISSFYRHMGDYGNLMVQNGTIKVKFYDKVSAIYGPFSIIGRTVVLHEKEDDLGLQPDHRSKIDGNSGPPIACGVIGIWS